MNKIQNQIFTILESVYRHGKETPNQDLDLPEGQLSVQQAWERINGIILDVIGEDHDIMMFKNDPDLVNNAIAVNSVKAYQKERAGLSKGKVLREQE